MIPSSATSLACRRVPSPTNDFGLLSFIEVSWDANETAKPIIPRGELRVVHLEITFGVTWGIGGRLINYLYRYSPVLLRLSVVDAPEWCIAKFAQQTLQFVLPEKDDTYVGWTLLMVQVDDTAPAFEVFPVRIHAIIEPLYGPLGFLTMMQGTSQNVSVAFTVAYKPLLAIHLPEGNIIETPPLVPVELPIGITNLGNGKTIVENEVVSYPSGWTITLPAQLVMEAGEYREMNLSLLAPYNFSSEASITLSCTPHSYDDYSLVGQTIYVNILAYYRPP